LDTVDALKREISDYAEVVLPIFAKCNIFDVRAGKDLEIKYVISEGQKWPIS